MCDGCSSVRLRSRHDTVKVSANPARERKIERKRKVKKLGKRAWNIWHSIRSFFSVSIRLSISNILQPRHFEKLRAFRLTGHRIAWFKERKRRKCRRSVSALILEAEETFPEERESVKSIIRFEQQLGTHGKCGSGFWSWIDRTNCFFACQLSNCACILGFELINRLQVLFQVRVLQREQFERFSYGSSGN